MMNHIMLDLETLDNRPTAVILSIGAVAFDPYEGTMGEQFFQNIDIESCLQRGLTVSGSNIAWWMQQNESARQIFNKTPVDLPIALKNFTHFIREVERDISLKTIVWGNGAGFDNVILNNAFEASGLDAPWEFRQNSCYRTMKRMFYDVPYDGSAIEHSSLHDAICQAQHLIKIFQIGHFTERDA